MFYIDRPAHIKTTDAGSAIFIGSPGGRSALLWTTPDLGKDYLQGFYRNLAIFRDAMGRYRLSRNDCSSSIYMILSSRPEYYMKRDSNTRCHILAPAEQASSVLLTTYSNPQDCNWHEMIIRANPGDIFVTLNRSDGGNFTPTADCAAADQPVPSHPGTEVYQKFFLVNRDRVHIPFSSDVTKTYRQILEGLHQQRTALKDGLHNIKWCDLATGQIISDLADFV